MAALNTEEMTQVVAEQEQQEITLTPAAAVKLGELMEEKGVRETHALRVFIQGGGCSGFQYGMMFDGAPRPVDTLFEQHGLRVVIDPQSLQYMTGSVIDFVDDPEAGGFHIDNPNSVSSCGSGGCGSCH
jgi:iron-sulfur cluster assembly protein